MNPFEQIIEYSKKRAVSAPVRPVRGKPLSKTGMIRALLEEAGRGMSASEILMELDLSYSANSSLIGMLLKWDIFKGRVIFKDNLYFWNDEKAAAEVQAVNDALVLLRKYGYKITKKNT